MRIGDRYVVVENKTLLLLRADAPTMATSLVAESKRMASKLLERVRSAAKSVNVIARLPGDPFAHVSNAPGFDVTVEVCADAELGTLAQAVAGIAADVPSARVDSAAPLVLVGRDYVFRPSRPHAIRFQYVMRRRADLSHNAFAQHYAEVHSEFGFKTWGTKGYAQFHVDPEASALAVTAAGFGVCDVDGVSQLSMPSLTRFLLSSPFNAVRGSLRDEKRFVDPEHSGMFASKIVARLP
jgi:hypothetical protein